MTIDLPCVDHVNGIERNQDSPMYGRLVVGTKRTAPIMLWKEPGCEPIADNLTGALLHNHPVTVEKRQRHNDRWYYYVSTAIRHEGQTYHQNGWVLDSFLRDIGG